MNKSLSFEHWLGAFLENRRKAQQNRRPTLTCLAVLSVRLGESPRRGEGTNHNNGGVKGMVRALLKSGFVKIFRVLGAPVVVEANLRSSRAMKGLDTGYVRARKAGRIRRVSAA